MKRAIGFQKFREMGLAGRGLEKKREKIPAGRGLENEKQPPT